MRLLFFAFLLTSSSAIGQSVVLTTENWNDLVPAGKEIDAIYGDTSIGSEHARGIIAATASGRKANMTVRDVGGCLIDLANRDFESDQLSAFYPGRRQFRFRSLITNDDGSVTVAAKGNGDRPGYTTVYRMDPDQPIIVVTSTWSNTTGEALRLQAEDDLRIDGRKEDMLRSPLGTEPFFFAADLHWQQAYGIFADGFNLQIDGNERESTLRWLPVDRQPISIPKDGTWTLTRKIIVARDLIEVHAIHDEVKGEKLATLKISLTDSSMTPIRSARVTFARGADSRGTAMSSDDGLLTVRLPTGSWKLTASVHGQKLPESGDFSVDVTDGENTLEWKSKIRRGVVAATITDHKGASIPAKVQFQAAEDALPPDWGPDTGEHFINNVAYTENGRFDAPLAAGRYDVIISHGPEYDAAYTTIDVKPGQTAQLRANLKRVVKTPGWVSADFHSHSSPSGDNTGSQRGRVLNLAAEHIEFAPCTEHNRVSTYSEHIEQLGLRAELATVSGMELSGSPLPINHQNVFPMVHRPRTQDGGGPGTDRSPETQIERLAAWDDGSEKLIQENHPDIGWLFFDQDGNQQPDRGFERAFDLIDVMEIHPIDRILNLQQFDVRNGRPVSNHRMLNWLQLLNQGFRFYGVVNTDAHYNFHGSGGLRNWIQSSTDDPSKINSKEMRIASEEGRLIMSNGPYLEAVFQGKGSTDSFVAGQDLAAQDGEVDVHIRVQCPNWIDINMVVVLVNGRVSEKHVCKRETHGRMFHNGPVRFDRRMKIRLQKDAHIVVATGHTVNRLGDVAGPSWGRQHPAALTNPVFVDVDGDGFEPIRDTLDFPLPVKFKE